MNDLLMWYVHNILTKCTVDSSEPLHFFLPKKYWVLIEWVALKLRLKQLSLYSMN